MKGPHGIAVQILGLNIPNGQENILYRSPLPAPLLPKHLGLGQLHPNNKVHPLRHKNILNLVEVHIILGILVALQTENEFLLVLLLVEDLLEVSQGLLYVHVPELFVLAELG